MDVKFQLQLNMKIKEAKEWKLRSTRRHEPHAEWLELQYKFIRELLKDNKDVSISLMGECWVFYNTLTSDLLATIDGEKGETLVY